MTKLMDKRSIAVWIAAWWLSACAGGQTGDATGDPEHMFGDFQAGRCEPTGETLGMDDPLPAGYSARELLERVADTTVPAFAWRNDEALFELSTDNDLGIIRPEDADAELELRVRVRYDGESRVPLYEDDCYWSDAVALAVTLTFEASDGSLDRDVSGILYSTPAGAYGYRDARAFFYADDDKVPPHRAYIDRKRACHEGPDELSFAGDGTPQGKLCDDRGRSLLFPTACGGIAQRPLDEQATAELPAPSETLAALGSRFVVTWPDETTSMLELTLAPATELACHFHTEYTIGWYAALELRVEWLDEGIAYTQPATLSVRDGMVDFDEPPMELESQALLNDEMIALLVERLDEPDLFFADSRVVIRETPDGELQQFYRIFGTRDVDEGENEIDLNMPLEPVDAP